MVQLWPVAVYAIAGLPLTSVLWVGMIRVSSGIGDDRPPLSPDLLPGCDGGHRQRPPFGTRMGRGGAGIGAGRWRGPHAPADPGKPGEHDGSPSHVLAGASSERRDQRGTRRGPFTERTSETELSGGEVGRLQLRSAVELGELHLRDAAEAVLVVVERARLLVVDDAIVGIRR